MILNVCPRSNRHRHTCEQRAVSNPAVCRIHPNFSSSSWQDIFCRLLHNAGSRDFVFCMIDFVIQSIESFSVCQAHTRDITQVEIQTVNVSTLLQIQYIYNNLQSNLLILRWKHVTVGGWCDSWDRQVGQWWTVPQRATLLCGGSAGEVYPERHVRWSKFTPAL